jgi:hypothetical protein
MAIEDNEFYAEKAKFQAETEAANKQTQEAKQKLEDMMVDNALKDAFTESGGKLGTVDDGCETPFEIVKHYLKNGRCELKDKQVVFKNQWGNIELDSDGKPKSVYQKMSELKQTDTFRGFFLEGDNNSNGARSVNDSLQKFEGNESQQQQQQQPGRKTYTREQARKGKASINDIASGKADIR